MNTNKFCFVKAMSLDELEKKINEKINGPGRWFVMGDVQIIEAMLVIQMRHIPTHPENSK